jgi:hypothetical protein
MMKRIEKLFQIYSDQKWFLWLGFFIYLVLIVLKQPDLILRPTFVGDDRRFFEYSYHHGWFQGLFNLSNTYLNLWLSGSTTIASKSVPLEYAAHVVVVASIVVFVCLGLVVISDASPFSTNLARVTALLVIPLFAHTAPILQLNYSHFFMGLIAVCILATNTEDKLLQRRLLLLLFCVGLSSPLVIFLTPIFILRHMLNRSSFSKLSTTVILICALIQFSAYLYTKQIDVVSVYGEDGANTHAERFRGIYQIDILVMWLTNLSTTNVLFGYLGNKDLHLSGFRDLGFYFKGVLLEKSLSYYLIVSICTTYIITFCFYLYTFSRRSKHYVVLWLQAALLLVASLSFVAAQHDPIEMLYKWGRYTIFPSILVIWIFIIIAEHSKNIQERWLFRSVLIWMLLFGILNNYPNQIPAYKINHSWNEEVKRWRDDPNHKPRVIPDLKINLNSFDK